MSRAEKDDIKQNHAKIELNILSRLNKSGEYEFHVYSMGWAAMQVVASHARSKTEYPHSGSEPRFYPFYPSPALRRECNRTRSRLPHSAGTQKRYRFYPDSS